MVLTSDCDSYKGNSVSKSVINIIIKNVSKSAEISYKMTLGLKKSYSNILRLLVF